MRILYWDTFAGISGDMALGSLIALGADPEVIIEQLHSIGLTEFVLEVRARQVHGIQATDIDVVIPLPNHADHEDHDHHKSHDDHHHRRLQDIQKMIMSGTLSERSRTRALLVFNVLAEAEARVHGTTLEEVHFHEVGAVDSLVDIVGTCIALDLLDIEMIRVSSLPWSHGFVHCAHGILPLPAPATIGMTRSLFATPNLLTGRGTTSASMSFSTGI